MAYTALSAKPVGTPLKLNVDGTPRNFIIVHQGLPDQMYDASCNGTWLLLEDIYENRVWKSDGYNTLETSDIHIYLNNEWIKKLDANIQSAVKQVKLPYRKGGGSGGQDQSGANGLLTKVFLLSVKEIGLTTESNYFPNDGAKLTYFASGNDSAAQAKRVAKLNNSAAGWWLRSPNTGNTSYVYCVGSSGDWNGYNARGTCGVRPALILPSDLLVSDDGTVSTNTAPTMPASITVPQSIAGGTTITLSWAASTDKEGNLSGYIVEKSINGGSQWNQIYQGPLTTTTDLVVFGTPTVMYRVKARDALGLESAYKASNQVNVVNNVAPTAPASITVPNTINGGSPLTITWGPATDTDGNLSGYQLERQVNGVGDWTQVFKGNQLTATDQITKGWNTVTYRVRAYDDLNVYGPYATSQAKTVNNNTAPTITCNDTNLGEKTAGFQVTYSVNDVDKDQVTVTEALDGAVLKTHTPVLGNDCTIDITGDTWQKVLNGAHELTITANDGKVSAVHKITFSKKVVEAVITLTTPLDADEKITLAVLSIIGSIPVDATYKVEVTNNAKDDEPKWEDATIAVKNGSNIVFVNQEATRGFAFNFKVTVKRGSSDTGGYIQSIQGGFQ